MFAVKTRWLRLLPAIVLAFLLAACGSGGGDDLGDGPATQAPVVSLQPVSSSVQSGTAVTFTVSIAGDGITYQWQRSVDAGLTWAAITGAVSASYTIAAVDPSMNGQQFRVQASAGGVTVASSAATLTVAAAVVAPAITVQPANQSALAGAAVTFSVTATGTSLAYQWQSSGDGATWAAVSGGASASLRLATVALADSGRRYRVLVSNSAGSAASDPATLTITAPPAAPAISTQPAATSVVAPAAATFTVGASGTAPLSYQWQLSTDNGASYLDNASATGASYTTAASSTADSGKLFRVRVSNSAGQVVSNPAVLTVTPAPTVPSITSQPGDQTVTAPAVATFSVTAAGNPTPTYQWQLSTDGGVNFTNINGATASSYTTPATSAGDTGRRFRAVISNSAGTATSSAALLTVLQTVTVTTHLAAGLGHSCAVTKVGAIQCWGANGNGQLGDGSVVTRRSPVRVTGLSSIAIQAVAAGDAHSCALSADGKVLCWGQNANGQLGDGTTAQRLVPTPVPSLTGVTQIATGSAHSCALRSNGTVACWGANFNGQLGDGTQADKSTPTLIAGITDAIGISAGMWHSCALRSNGTMACWGANQYYQVGSEGVTRFAPAAVTGLTGVAKIALGPWHSCAVKVDGSVVCFGLSILGQLGAGTIGFNSTFAPVAGLANAVAAAPGISQTCAVKADHTVACWGTQSGFSGGGSYVAISVSSLDGVQELAGGSAHNCALKTDGSVVCWGANEFSQLGDGTSTFRSSPVTVPGLNLLN